MAEPTNEDLEKFEVYMNTIFNIQEFVEFTSRSSTKISDANRTAIRNMVNQNVKEEIHKNMLISLLLERVLEQREILNNFIDIKRR